MKRRTKENENENGKREEEEDEEDPNNGADFISLNGGRLGERSATPSTPLTPLRSVPSSALFSAVSQEREKEVFSRNKYVQRYMRRAAIPPAPALSLSRAL